VAQTGKHVVVELADDAVALGASVVDAGQVEGQLRRLEQATERLGPTEDVVDVVGALRAWCRDRSRLRGPLAGR
jgi:hypothetical protein